MVPLVALVMRLLLLLLLLKQLHVAVELVLVLHTMLLLLVLLLLLLLLQELLHFLHLPEPLLLLAGGRRSGSVTGAVWVGVLHQLFKSLHFFRPSRLSHEGIGKEVAELRVVELLKQRVVGGGVSRVKHLLHLLELLGRHLTVSRGLLGGLVLVVGGLLVVDLLLLLLLLAVLVDHVVVLLHLIQL